MQDKEMHELSEALLKSATEQLKEANEVIKNNTAKSMMDSERGDIPACKDIEEIIRKHGLPAPHYGMLNKEAILLVLNALVYLDKKLEEKESENAE